MERFVHDSAQGAALPAVLHTEAPASFYRCFFLHKSGCIDKANIIEARSDEDALLWALKLVDSQSRCTAVEVWQGPRKVFPVTRAHADIEQLKRVLSAMGLITADGPLASQSASAPT